MPGAPGFRSALTPRAPSVSSQIAAQNRGHRRALQTELLRRDFIDADPFAAHLADLGRPADGNLVQTVSAVDHQCPLQSQQFERLRQFFHQVLRINAHHLR